MRFFRSNSDGLVGVDVSSGAIRIVELEGKDERRVSLKHCVSEPIARGAVVDGNVERIDDVAEAIRSAFQKNHITTKNVALALPRNAVITKRVVMPAGMAEDEIEAQVIDEANQYVPFSVEDVALDFCVIGPSRSSPGDLDVMIAAARRERVDDMEQLAELSGLTLKIVDVAGFAAKRAVQRMIDRLPGSTRTLCVGVFDFDASITNLSVYRDDETIYERDHPFGTGELTLTIARNYGLSEEEAEEKRKAGDLPDDFESNVMRPFIESISMNTANAVDQYIKTNENDQLDYLMLAGGSSVVSRLLEQISANTGISTMLANPFEGIEFTDGVTEKRIQKESLGFLVASGLALRKFNL